MTLSSRLRFPLFVHIFFCLSITESFTDKLLEKDVAKNVITAAEAEEARARLSVTTYINDLKDADVVVEVFFVIKFQMKP